MSGWLYLNVATHFFHRTMSFLYREFVYSCGAARWLFSSFVLFDYRATKRRGLDQERLALREVAGTRDSQKIVPF